MKLVRLLRTDLSTLYVNPEKVVSLAEARPTALNDMPKNTTNVLVEGDWTYHVYGSPSEVADKCTS